MQRYRSMVLCTSEGLQIVLLGTPFVRPWKHIDSEKNRGPESIVTNNPIPYSLAHFNSERGGVKAMVWFHDRSYGATGVFMPCSR